MRAQSTDISHVLKESSRKFLLTLCALLSPPTPQIHVITKYDTSLYVALENSSRDTRNSI